MFRRSLGWTGGHREDAEDALSEAALAALTRMPLDLQPDEARGWLRRLVYNKCMDLHRRRRSAPWAGSASVIEVEGTAAGLDIESALLESELMAVARERIRNLPPRLRKVAELYLLQGLPYSRVADLLALTEANVRKRMQETRALLREHLKAYLAGDVRIPSPRPPVPGRKIPAIEDPEPLPASAWSREALERYVRRHLRGWRKRWELALRLREEGSLEEAALHLREAASRQPRRVELWSELGTTLLLLGRGEEAREAFETALRHARTEEDRARLRKRMAGP